MWPPAATLFVLDPRRMKTPDERFKCLGSSKPNFLCCSVLIMMSGLWDGGDGMRNVALLKHSLGCWFCCLMPTRTS